MKTKAPQDYGLTDLKKSAKTQVLTDMIIGGEIAPLSSEKPWMLPPIPSGKIFTDGFSKYISAKEKPLKKKNELGLKQRELFELVEAKLAGAPIQVEDRIWANLSAEHIAKEIGVSVRHARRLYAENPFRHVVKSLDGKKTTLVRIAHPSDLTPEDQARMMVKFWKNQIGRTPSRHDFGCLVGIAKDLPTGTSYDIFRTVVLNWSPFMCGVKLAQNFGQYEGDHFDPNPENFYSRFLLYPNIGVIRRFIHVAVDLYMMALKDVES